jgi:hypothetical protein
LEAGEYPFSFTGVPILALDTATFAQIIYTDRNQTHLGLCKKLIEFNPESGEASSHCAVNAPTMYLEVPCANSDHLVLYIHEEKSPPPIFLQIQHWTSFSKHASSLANR